MKSISDLRIAIIGGGIGGASVAVALKNAGFHAEVYEQVPEIREVGAGIGLRPPTIRCFKAWGMYDRIEKVTTHSDYLEMVSGSGEAINKEKWPVLTEDQSERYARFIQRADLLDSLISQLPPETIHLAHRCKSIVDHGEFAEILFENGNKIEADLVIAADGIRSVVRDQVFGTVDPVYSGYHAYRTLVKHEDTFGLVSQENSLRIFIEGLVQVYLLPLPNRNEVSVDITAPSADYSPKPKVTKQDMMNAVQGFNPKMVKMVENIRIEDITCRALYDIDALDRWSTKCVTLVGDAAHAMLHNMGQGANMAIQDGEALAAALRESETLPEALHKYETSRKPINHKYQELSRLFPNKDWDPFPDVKKEA